jgi:hypothetical protein
MNTSNQDKTGAHGENRHGLLSYQNVACITVPSDERSVEFNQLLSDHYLDHNNGHHLLAVKRQ